MDRFFVVNLVVRATIFLALVGYGLYQNWS